MCKFTDKPTEWLLGFGAKTSPERFLCSEVKLLEGWLDSEDDNHISVFFQRRVLTLMAYQEVSLRSVNRSQGVCLCKIDFSLFVS